LFARELCHDQTKDNLGKKKTKKQKHLRDQELARPNELGRATPTPPTTEMKRKHKTKQMGME